MIDHHQKNSPKYDNVYRFEVANSSRKKVLTITGALDGEFSSFSVCKKTSALNTNESSVV